MKRGKKNIFLLGGSSFFNDVGSEMITPILPFYITALGGGGISIGLVSGLREGLASLFKLAGGWASDKTKKRIPFVFLGYFFSLIARFLLILANAWQWIVTLVAFERFGKLRDPPRDAIIADSTNHSGSGFGLHQAMDTSGAIFGTLIAIILFWKFGFGFKSIILVAASVSVFSLIPLFFVKEPRKKSKIKKVSLEGATTLNPKLKYFIFVVSVFTLANFGMYMFLLLRVKELTGSTVIALSFYMLFSFSYAAFAIPFGMLSDKIGRKKVLLIGYALLVIVSLGFTNSATLPTLITMFFFYGMVYAITQSNQRAMVSDLTTEKKATAFGFYESTIGLVNIPAGIIAGLLWDISYTTMFIYVAAVAALAAILLMFVKEEK